MTHTEKYLLKDDTLEKLCGLAVLAEKLATETADGIDCASAIAMAQDPDVRDLVGKLQAAGLVIR